MKKRRIAVWALALLLIASLCITAYAAGGDSAAQLGYVTDAADILSPEQEADLQRMAADISARHEFSVYVITLHDYRDYTSSSTIANCCMEMYDGYQLGWGADRDGILLLLSIAERDYDLDAHGTFGNAAFSDYGKDLLAEEFLDDFSYNDWATGFEDYIETAYSFAMTARNGEPVDSYGGRTADENVTPGKVLALILVPALVALIVCSTVKSKMKSAVQKTEAADYMQTQNIRLTKTRDQFTHVTTTRTHIDRSRSTGGGGGGTTINSAGHSHSSGKF